MTSMIDDMISIAQRVEYRFMHKIDPSLWKVGRANPQAISYWAEDLECFSVGCPTRLNVSGAVVYTNVDDGQRPQHYGNAVFACKEHAYAQVKHVVACTGTCQA